ITRGFGIAVTAVPLMSQCAEMQRIARGRGNDCPKLRHAAVKRLSSRVFIGLPCPMNAAGMGALMDRLSCNSPYDVPHRSRLRHDRGGRFATAFRIRRHDLLL